MNNSNLEKEKKLSPDEVKKYNFLANNYQSTIRNVGLYTSISLAFLGYSRYYRGKNKLYNIGPILISLVFNFVSLLFLYFLYNQQYKYIGNNSEQLTTLMNERHTITSIMWYTIFIITLFTLFTLGRQFKK